MFSDIFHDEFLRIIKWCREGGSSKPEPKRIYTRGTIVFRLSPDIGRQTWSCVNARRYRYGFGVSTLQR